VTVHQLGHMSNGHVSAYPASTVREARELAAAGWKPMEIVRILARRGVDPLPSAGAVKWWLRGTLDIEAQMEAQRRHKARRSAERSGGRMLGGRPRTPEFKLARARALRAEGLSLRAVATVMSFDFEPVSERQVRHALEAGRWPDATGENAA